MATQNQTIRKILIAPDKFKGSLTSTQAALAIKRGIEERYLLPDRLSLSAADSDAVAAGALDAAGAVATAAVTSEASGVAVDSDAAAASDVLVADSASVAASAETSAAVSAFVSDTACGDVSAGYVSGDICAPEFRIIEIADGGDGSLEVLQKKIPGATIADITVCDPLGRAVPSQILLYTTACAGNGAESRSEGENVTACAGNEADSRSEGERVCAFIEMAKVSGLEMLARGERNPLHTSTYGMGEAIRAAISRGATQITLSIGGSATNDGGAGMLQALGYRFFDAAGVEIPAPICGGDLQRIAVVESPDTVMLMGNESGGSVGIRMRGVEFKVICDVTNPLLGPQGATAVYGPQKGADAQALELLEAGLANYAAVAERCLGIPKESKTKPGAGAAGGVGYAGLAFLGAELIAGWRFFAQITSLEESVQWADLVITGEGSLDSQSLSGKVVSGVLNLAAKYHKPVKIFCGVSKLTPTELEGVSNMLPEGVGCYQIASLGQPIEVCMREAAPLLQYLARENV